MTENTKGLPKPSGPGRWWVVRDNGHEGGYLFDSEYLFSQPGDRWYRCRVDGLDPPQGEAEDKARVAGLERCAVALRADRDAKADEVTRLTKRVAELEQEKADADADGWRQSAWREHELAERLTEELSAKADEVERLSKRVAELERERDTAEAAFADIRAGRGEARAAVETQCEQSPKSFELQCREMADRSFDSGYVLGQIMANYKSGESQ